MNNQGVAGLTPTWLTNPLLKLMPLISKSFPENRAPLECLIREKEEITYITLTEVIEDIRQR